MKRLMLLLLGGFLFIVCVAAAWGYGIVSSKKELFPYPQVKSAIAAARNTFDVLFVPHHLYRAVYDFSGARVNDRGKVSKGVTLVTTYYSDLDWRPGIKLLDADGNVPIEAIAKVPLILPTERHGLRLLLDQHLRRFGVSTRVPIEIDAFLQIQRLVQRGQGMTILSLAALHESDLDPPLRTARIVGPTIERTVYLARADNRPQTKAARETGRLAAELLRAEASLDWWHATPVE